VLALARVVERRAPEIQEERRRGQRDGERRREERGALRAQVRETRMTPATMKPMPSQRAGVTTSASRSCASSATTT
jgi:hypothetical protein